MQIMSKYYNKELPIAVNVFYGGRRAGVTYREIEKLKEEINKLQKEIGAYVLDINRLRKQRDSLYEKIENAVEYINGNSYDLTSGNYMD